MERCDNATVELWGRGRPAVTDDDAPRDRLERRAEMLHRLEPDCEIASNDIPH